MFSALHSCGHVSNWRDKVACPDVNDWMTCGRCGQVVRVVDVLGPWRVKCLDCHKLDGHATFRKTVMNTAIAHVQQRTWRAHRVRVWQFGNSDSIVIVCDKNVGAQPALPGTEGAPF
jgi:hypothetical protein